MLPEVLSNGACSLVPHQDRLVVTVEDNGRHGGFGWALAAALRDASVDTPLRDLGIPQTFHEHGERAEVLADIGLTAQDVSRRITEWIAAAEPAEMGATVEK